MLAVTASTAPPEPAQTRATGSEELDRAERGANGEEEGSVEGDEGGGDVETEVLERETRMETGGYEHTVINVGVVETIKMLWGSEVPIVRRFR